MANQIDKSKLLIALIAIISLLACIINSSQNSTLNEQLYSLQNQNKNMEINISDLQQSVGNLLGVVQDLNFEQAQTISHPQSGKSRKINSHLKSVNQRLEDLDKKINAMNKNPTSANGLKLNADEQKFAKQFFKSAAMFNKKLTDEELNKLTSLALDETAKAENRVDALLKLRIQRPEARKPEMIDSFLNLAENSEDPKIRSDILRHIKGVVPIESKSRIIWLLNSDSSAEVREEAAEALGPLNSDPDVRAALENAAKSDNSFRVKRQAASSLK